MKFIVPFLCFYSSIILSLHAQSNWQRGYLVTNSNDTLRGVIDARDWTSNPKHFSFKKTAESATQEKFTIAQVNYFEITENNYYHRYVVSISQDKVGIDVPETFNNKTIIDTVFLKILQRGKRVTLLSYKDDIKNRFFLIDKNQNPVELVYQLYVSNGQEHKNEQYKTQLKFAAETSGTFSPKLDWLIKKSTYGNRSLIDIVSSINEINERELKVERQRSKTRPRVDFFAGGGINIASLSYRGNTNTSIPWIKDESKSRSTSSNPYFIVGFNVRMNPSVGKAIFRLDLSYNASKFNTTATSTGISSKAQIDYTFSQSTFSLTPQFIYNFYNKQNLKFFAGIGIRVNSSTYGNNIYTITSIYPSSNVSSSPDYFLLKKSWFSGSVEIGATINRKIEVCLYYIPALEDLNGGHTVWYESVNSVRVGLSYNFIRK